MTAASDGTASARRDRNLVGKPAVNSRRRGDYAALSGERRRFSTDFSTATWRLESYADLVMNIRSTLETRGAR